MTTFVMEALRFRKRNTISEKNFRKKNSCNVQISKSAIPERVTTA